MSNPEQSQPQPLRAVVVGTSFGARVHVPALRAAGFEVIALVGRDRERTRSRAAELDIALGATSLAEALASGPVDAVTVSTPPDSHTTIVFEALANGKHVLCEKPFAANATEAQSMVAAAEAAGVVALVGCEFRWATDEALASRLLRLGAIGNPRVATYIQHSSLVANGLHGAFNDEWWFDASRGGGILNAGGIHYIDRFLDWLGPIDAVSAVLQVTGDRPHDGAEDTYTAMFRFASGCVGLLQHCAAARGNPSRLCRVIGDAGSVWLEGGATWMAEDTPAREVAVPDDLRLPDPPPPSSDPKHAFTSIELPPYTRLAERWRDLILGLPVSPNAPVTPTFAAGLASQQVLDAMRASSLGNGAWVPVS